MKRTKKEKKRKKRVLLSEYPLSPAAKLTIKASPTKTLLKKKVRAMDKGKKSLVVWIDKEIVRRQPKLQERWVKQAYWGLPKRVTDRTFMKVKRKVEDRIEKEVRKQDKILQEMEELAKKGVWEKYAEKELELNKSMVKESALINYHKALSEGFENALWADVAEKGSEKELELMKTLAELKKREIKTLGDYRNFVKDIIEVYKNMEKDIKEKLRKARSSGDEEKAIRLKQALEVLKESRRKAEEELKK